MGKTPVQLRPVEAAILKRFDALKPGPKDKDLAAAAGISQEKISNVRRGVRRFNAEEVQLIEPWLDQLEQAAADPGATPDLLPTRSADAGDIVEITAVDMSYAMGDGTDIDDYIESEPVKFDLALIRAITRSPPHRLRLARGIGDSMLPTLQTNDRVMIDTTQNMLKLDDRVYAISRFGAGSIKRLRTAGKGRVLVISDNPAVDNMEVDAEDLIIHGRVVWFARDL